MLSIKKQKAIPENIDEELIEYIKKLRFRRRLLGIDEKELWTVISNIQKFYARKNLENEIRYKTLIEERDHKITELTERLGEVIYGDIHKENTCQGK